MPNHIHGIIVIYNPEPSFGQPQGLPLRKTLGEIVGVYKSLAAAECLKVYKNNNISMGKFWQRNVYEHIIRNEESYMRLLKNKSSAGKIERKNDRERTIERPRCKETGKEVFFGEFIFDCEKRIK